MVASASGQLADCTPEDGSPLSSSLRFAACNSFSPSSERRLAPGGAGSLASAGEGGDGGTLVALVLELLDDDQHHGRKQQQRRHLVEKTVPAVAARVVLLDELPEDARTGMVVADGQHHHQQLRMHPAVAG
eukprot:Opistho-1_new@93129